MRSLRTLAVVAVVVGLSGCELIADFDRGKLEQGQPDAGHTVPPEPDGDDAGGMSGDADAGK